MQYALRVLSDAATRSLARILIHPQMFSLRRLIRKLLSNNKIPSVKLKYFHRQR